MSETLAVSVMRLATLNVKHGAAEDAYLSRPENTAKAVDSLAADVLALQEVDNRTVRSGFTNLASLAAERSGMDYRFAPTLKFRFGSYGNALLVRGLLEDYEVVTLEGGHRFKPRAFGHQLKIIHEPRNILLATVKVRDLQISLAATHLATEPTIRRQQLPLVVAALLERPAPHVLLGDLNQSLEEIREQDVLGPLALVQIGATHSDRQIDHIATHGLRVACAETRQLPVSDHKAAIADVLIA